MIEMAAAKERGHQEYREPSEHTRLKWRVKSTPSSKYRRQRLSYCKWDHQLREELGQSPPKEELSQSAHTSKLQGQHQNSSLKDGSPMEELHQSAPSTVPFGISTQEKLRLH